MNRTMEQKIASYKKIISVLAALCDSGDLQPQELGTTIGRVTLLGIQLAQAVERDFISSKEAAEVLGAIDNIGSLNIESSEAVIEEIWANVRALRQLHR